MRAVAVVGFKKSGKTAVTGQVADALERRGCKVGIVKFTHHGLDRQNTDTFWLMREGRTVAGCGPEEAAMFWSRPVPVTELVAAMDADIVLIEGGREYVQWPRILCLREPGEESELVDGLPQPAVLATVGAQPDVALGPHFPEMTSEAADGLAELVLEHAVKMPVRSGQRRCRPCPTHAAKEVCPATCPAKPGVLSITVDGREISLNGFAERITANTLRGLLESLEGCAGGRHIVLTLRSGDAPGQDLHPDTPLARG